MSSHPPFCPEHLWQGLAQVRENVQLARQTYRLRLDCPALAAGILPGQFVMLRLPGSDDPLLGRPFALYDTFEDSSGETAGIDLVYLVQGRLTGRLAQVTPGGRVQLWGPLGNGFRGRPTEHLVLVAGGIGQTPFPATAREALGLGRYGQPARSVPKVKKVTLCYGVRSADYLAGLQDFAALGVEVQVSTDDGSRGLHGRVSQLLESVLRSLSRETATGPTKQMPLAQVHVLCCGPEPMMASVAELTDRLGVSCEVSLETPMACGLGICFSCVAKVRTPDGGWDYVRTCVEGPVFDAKDIVF